MLDLESYFQRIRYSGKVVRTLETLASIQQCHAQTIAFENLNSFMGIPIPLDLEALQEKMVRARRGGYCFEQNLLFSHVLRMLGFRVVPLAARVNYNAPADVVLPRTHMLLRIDLGDGPYIVDVGFGSFTLTTPLRAEADIEQDTTNGIFRLQSKESRLFLQAQTRREWKALYNFSLEEEHLLPDFEAMNWYVSHYPQSRFVTNLIAARPEGDRRYTLFNTEFAIHYADGRTQRTLLTEAASLRKTLEGPFELVLDDLEGVDAALSRVVERSMQGQKPSDSPLISPGAAK